MPLQYIDAAMHLARREILDDGADYQSDISEYRGVFANTGTSDAWREQFAEV